MKHIQVVAYCDGDHESRTLSVVERTIAVDGSKPILLDLCEEDDQLIQQIQRLMERGTVAEPQKKAAKKSSHDRPSRTPESDLPTTCPACGLHSASRSALGQHMRVQHNKGLKDFTEEQMNAAEENWKQQSAAV